MGFFPKKSLKNLQYIEFLEKTLSFEPWVLKKVLSFAPWVFRKRTQKKPELALGSLADQFDDKYNILMMNVEIYRELWFKPERQQ